MVAILMIRIRTAFATVLTIVLSVLIVLPEAATAKSPVSVGVKGGLLLSDFYGDDAGDTSRRTAFTAGGVVGYAIDRYISLQAEAVVSVKGSNEDIMFYNGSGFVPAESRIRLTYLEFPLYLKAGIPTHSGVKGFLTVGGFLAVELENKLDFITHDDTVQGLLYETNSVLPGFLLGVGCEIPLNSGVLALEARSELDLKTNFNRPAAILGLEERREVKNRVFTVTLSLTF